MVRHRIKDILKEKGLTQNDLAQKMGTTQETVSRQINGNPTLNTLTDIATTLNVDVWELFTVKTDKKELYGFLEYNNKVYRITGPNDLKRLLEEVGDRE